MTVNRRARISLHEDYITCRLIFGLISSSLYVCSLYLFSKSFLFLDVDFFALKNTASYGKVEKYKLKCIMS